MAAPDRHGYDSDGEPPAKRPRMDLGSGITKKRTVFLSDNSIGAELARGRGMDPRSPHRFSTGVFGSSDAFAQYASDTGLEATGVQQQWGAVRGTVLRSRRGSLGGFTELEGGQVAAWRWSSYATSRGLAALGRGGDPMAAYRRQAVSIGTKAKNSAGRQISPNAILSEAGHVAFDAGSGGFSLEQTSYAQGLSAAGVDWKRSRVSPAAAYGATRRAAAAAGIKPSPSHSHHSEGMALGFHDEVRDTPLSASSDMLLMATSIPNQVCKNCGRAFQAGLGQGGYVAGMPGRPFGGQKMGQTDAPSGGRGAAVFRAEPTLEALASSTNLAQVGAIFGAHGSGPMQPSPLALPTAPSPLSVMSGPVGGVGPVPAAPVSPAASAGAASSSRKRKRE